MANLQATLLRFMNDVMGSHGDISNMFYMVRATKEGGDDAVVQE